MQGESQTVCHDPHRLLRDAEIAGDFAGANPVLAVHNQPQRGQPLVEAERRVLENRPGLQGELCLRMLAVALPRARGFEIDDMVRAALRTRHLAIGPAEFS